MDPGMRRDDTALVIPAQAGIQQWKSALRGMHGSRHAPGRRAFPRTPKPGKRVTARANAA